MPSLFFSYSHKDEEVRNDLEVHLALLKRQGIITAWHDRRIVAGDFGAQISEHLENADIILFVVSAQFIASDYCYEREMQRALEKDKEGTAIVRPVIAEPCDWHSAPFGHLLASPTDGKAISLYANRQEALSIVAKDVRAIAETFAAKTPAATPPPTSATATITYTVQQYERSSNLRVKQQFSDHEKDEFVENTYEYIARYFEGSLAELQERNARIQTRFKRMDNTSFTASVYSDGKQAAQCSIWYASRGEIFSGIAYSASGNGRGNSYNEVFHVEDDGYSQFIKPLGINVFANNRNEQLSQQGAAEYYWSMFIQRLQ